MLRIMCYAKIQNARITETELEYQGSITIDQDILDAAGIRASERVQVVNLANGSRLETYVISAPSGSGRICLNGPAARKGYVGDRVHVLAYGLMDDADAGDDFELKTVALDSANKILNAK